MLCLVFDLCSGGHLSALVCALTVVAIWQHRKAEFTDESAPSCGRQVCLSFACGNYAEPKFPESAVSVGKGASLVQAFGSLGWNRIRPCHQRAGSFKRPNCSHQQDLQARDKSTGPMPARMSLEQLAGTEVTEGRQQQYF